MNKFTYDPSQYTGFRPQYPDALFEFLEKLTDKKNIVLECGAGSGQSTMGLSKHFDRIIATELSFELLSQAPSLSNVNYVQSSAEQLPIRAHIINLVCVAQAIHWFSHDKFYEEVKRVLIPSGVIAAWGYNQAIIEPDVDNVIKKVYAKITGSQNPSRERQYLYDQYKTLPFPFERIAAPEFNIKVKWNLMQWLGYMSTWPGVLEYNKKFSVNLVDEIQDEIALAWGDTTSEKLVIWPICFLIGRYHK